MVFEKPFFVSYHPSVNKRCLLLINNLSQTLMTIRFKLRGVICPRKYWERFTILQQADILSYLLNDSLDHYLQDLRRIRSHQFPISIAAMMVLLKLSLSHVVRRTFIHVLRLRAPFIDNLM